MKKSVVQRPKRWDEPLSADISEAQIEFILSSHHFRQMSEDNFPGKISLRDVVRNDCRIRTYEKDQLIVRAGAYLNSAFILLTGHAVMVLAPGISPRAWGQTITPKPSVKESFLNWLTKPKGAEVRSAVSVKAKHTKKSASKATTIEAAEEEDGLFIKNLKKWTSASGARLRKLSTGDIFGESAVMGRNEMPNTIVAKTSCVVLEIRWQGLRELRSREPAFKEFIDTLYRKRGLFDYLLEVPLFKQLPKEKVRQLASTALFETHGKFEWHTTFQAATKKTVIDDSFDHLIESEPIVAEEGSYPDGLLLVRNGFGRISRKVNHGHYTFGHLSSGDLFGLEETYDSWKAGKPVSLNCSFRALGYTDVIRIPSGWLEENIFKSGDSATRKILKKLVTNRTERRIEQTSDTTTKKGKSTKKEPTDSKVIDRKLTEFVVENRLINGTQTMMIDLERCVRCDDCVTACANAHDNNPRFNRHGLTFGTDTGKYMFANACMHCVDPVCMIGCPTGAIHRSEEGVVTINDPTCIGCSTCANSCPYDNIRMVPARDGNNKAYVDKGNQPIMKATKCDLCSQTSGTPACERACSHDALTRIDLKDITKLADWVSR